MPTIVLRDQENQDHGFLLIAGDDVIFTSGERDVVFMALPSLATSPIATFFQEFKHVEFKARIATTDAGGQISVVATPHISFVASLNASGTGSWSATTIGNGLCQLLGGG